MLIGTLLLGGCAVAKEEGASVDSVVEKDATETDKENDLQSDPQPEETPKKDDQTSNIKTDSDKETKMSFGDALAIAKEKAFRRDFNNALTDQQREALTVYLTEENNAYLQGQEKGNISAFKEAGGDAYILELHLFTTKKAVGQDLTALKPLALSTAKGTLSKVDSDVLDITEIGENRYYYPRILEKKVKDSADYLKNVSFESAVPEGQMRLRLTLDAPATRQTVEELVTHYLGLEQVTWIELSYHVEEDSSNPTAIHPFWETEKELPFEEARTIVVEKICKRFNEKLSDKERMAFYVVFSARGAQSHYYCYEENYSPSLYFYVGKEYSDLDPQSELKLDTLNLPPKTLLVGKNSSLNQMINISKQDIISKNAYDDSESYLITAVEASFSIRIVQDHIASDNWTPLYKKVLRHLLSLDCSAGISESLYAPPGGYGC